MGGSWIADNQGANNKYQENYDQQYGYREPGPTNAPGETTTRQTVIVGVGQASFHYSKLEKSHLEIFQFESYSWISFIQLGFPTIQYFCFENSNRPLTQVIWNMPAA